MVWRKEAVDVPSAEVRNEAPDIPSSRGQFNQVKTCKVREQYLYRALGHSKSYKAI